MTATVLMTPRQVATESGRNYYSVRDALRRGLLKGTQSHAGARWQVQRPDFEDWMARGRPIDDPARRDLRRSA